MEKPQAHSSSRIRSYVAVFGVLAVLTAVEVGVTYTSLPRVPVLVPLAVFKAALVVLFYMHVKYDRKLFGLIFAMGLLMGVGLILALLALISTPLIQAVQ
jgi:cytochrome c oxidase subunit IV